jgi:hypothetical protein
MTRLMKFLMVVVAAVITGGQMVHATCFDENVRLELVKITSDTRQTLDQALGGPVDDAKLQEYVKGQLNLVSALANMCGGYRTDEGAQIFQEGDASIKALLVNYQRTRQDQNSDQNSDHAKIIRIGIERTGGPD